MENTDERTKNRMLLLLIAGIPVTMILSATWLWFFVVRGDLDLVGALGTANRGVLVQPPRQIDEANILEPNGSSFRYANLKPKWTMLIPGTAGRCDTICENTLYLTRQVHVALGKEFNRLQRFYVSDTGPDDTQLTVKELSDKRPAPASFATYLASEHRGLRPLVLDPGGMDRFFAEFRTDPSSWYLVDPSGWIMMTYNKDIPYKDVIADLKFLLKNSGD
jgi:cytochrome oxidase Cu insertion factor (SCO1/SenC/PrrC family)